MIFLYRIFYVLLFYPLFWILSFFNAKIEKGFELRAKQNGLWPWLNFTRNTQPIWIHASSMEFEYAKPVIRELKEKHPHSKIIVTFFSPSAANACKKFPGVDFACPAPWDQPQVLKEFLEFHNPKALLLARTDTWPEMLFQTRIRGIPALLFSSTFPSTSSRNRFGVRRFYRWVFSHLHKIFVVSDEDFQTFQKIGVEQIEKMGDTRYDQVLFRLAHPQPIKSEFLTPLENGITFIAGSTWPEDEAVLLPAIHQIVKEKIPVRFILVPHEPTSAHLSHLEKNLAPLKLNYYSRWHRPLGINEVILVDQIGILAELYAQAELAFIGGSFKKNVHSVMEALACGCQTLVGPLHFNNREALEFKNRGVTEVKDVTAIVEQVRAFTKMSSGDRTKNKNQIRSLVVARSGASPKIIDWVEQVSRLKPASSPKFSQ